MIFIHKANKYSPFGTHIPDCKSVPFDGGANKMNIGGLGFNAATNNAVRATGIKINGSIYTFDVPVEFINRTNYGVQGIYPNASEIVGNTIRTFYYNEFGMEDVPFLFTCGWDATLQKNYTAHAIDNSSITGHTNTSSYLIYQFQDNLGVWGSNTGNTYNLVSTASLAIESDIDPYMRCSLENISTFELKSLYTTKPDIIFLGVPDNPSNLTILLTYVSHLSSEFIDQLFYPILQKGVSTGCEVNKIGAVNMTNSLKTELQNLGWTVNF